MLDRSGTEMSGKHCRDGESFIITNTDIVSYFFSALIKPVENKMLKIGRRDEI